ncbi:cytochrome c oxidase subunit II [Allocoleopsis franciscana]|uniref:Cytochrome c oxidase subunit 2 n=1 Tax=Allocoleopsis franciscana PCC 7113 TaxID=1173027 RepID=K9WGX4_9CYAN|nr:cytochrome c oxidase subunit II [Allocoleopsis franciscana]AFZ19453.1 heme/copper-type cytochrome/quinol oxidases, subunit 2 [Allocoleopsis franciscana PCC 7113]
MNIPSQIATLLAGIVLTLISLWYGQNHGLMPVAASDEAAQVDALFNMMMTIATGLFLLVEGTLIVAAIRYRRRPGDNSDGPPIHGNIPLEIVWTAIPAVTVLIIAVYSFEIYNAMGGLDPMVSHDHHHAQVAHADEMSTSSANAGKNLIALDPSRGSIALGLGASPEHRGEPVPMTVNVMGLQYAWLFTYPESGVTTGELHIPVGQEVQLNISAQDVLHAFWLPEFRLKQDAIPGRETQLRFTPNQVGQYPIVCAELCGAYHGAMGAQLFVQTPEEFQAWLQEQQAVASNETSEKTLAAANPTEQSSDEFLAPYTQDMGISSKTLEQLHSSPEHLAQHLAVSNQL